MAIPASAISKVRSPRKKSEPADESLLKSLGRGTLSGLAMAGNVLDLPGSSVRDFLSGENPLDQWASPISGENRVSGRDMLERWGALGRNRKGLDFGDVAGFGAEVLADPLTYMTFGASALGKGGQVLSKASGNIGKLSRVGRMTTDVATEASRIAPEALSHAARAAGYADSGAFLAARGSEKIGGLAGLGLPMRAPLAAIGTGPTAQKIGGALDKLGNAARYSAPGRVGAALFSKSNRGALSRAGQELGQAADAGERAAGVAARETYAPHLRSFEGYSQTLPDMAARLDANDAFNAAVEKTAPLPPGMAHLQPDVDAIKQLHADDLAAEQADGLLTSDLDDLSADYNFRRAFFFPGDKSKSDFPALLLSGKHGAQTQRKTILRDIPGGTSSINRLSVDPRLSGVAHAMKPADKTPQFWAQQTALVDQVLGGHANSPELAKWLADLDPRHASEGVPKFPHNPVENAALRSEMSKRARSMAQTLRESLKSTAVDFMQAPPGSVPVEDVIERAGLNVPETMQLAGLSPKSHVPKELAEDVGRVVKSFRQPEEVGVVLKAIDKFTAMFKAGVLTWPARYTRDFSMGQVQNALTGAWSWRSMNDADKLIRGRGPISGLQDLGGNYAGLSDAAATSKFADEIFAHEVASTSQGITSQGAVAGTSLSRNMASDIPGVAPIKLRKIAQKAIPKNLAQANPFNIAGVRGSETVNSVVAAGNDFGHFTDANIRITGYLELRRKGWSPEKAAERIRQTQVDYQNLSSFESGVMRRAAPFYSFTRGMAEFLVSELANRPGGVVAQTIRAQNSARSDDTGPVPDYINKGLAIPLGETSTGDKSFLTGLDFMHDAPANLVGFDYGGLSLPGTIRNVLSQGNPLPKGIAELGFGKTLFQDRDLEDSDPTIGRLISNVSDLSGMGKRELPSGRARPFINTTFEQIAANSPASRLLSTARVATDSRKLEGGPFPGSLMAMNLLTGAKVAQVSPGSQEAVLRDALAEMSKREGASEFASVRFTRADIAEAKKTNPELAARMEALNRAATELTNRAKARKKLKPPARR